MGELMIENPSGASASDPPPPAPAPAPPRRPRVREVSSRFMSPQVSSSSESPHHNNTFTSRSPIHRHNLGSTPIPNPSDHHLLRPRSSSANRRRRQLDMEQTLGGDTSDSSSSSLPSSPRASMISDSLEQVPSTNLRRVQRATKVMKENIGNRQTPIPVHYQGKKCPPRPDTPGMVSVSVSASLDRSISVPSRFRATPKRPNSNTINNNTKSVVSSSSSSLSSQESDSGGENAAQVSSSTQSLPELLLVKAAGNRTSADSLKISAFTPSRYLNSNFGDSGGGGGVERLLPGRDPGLPLPVPAAARKAKKAAGVPSHLDDCHTLKLLHNRHLQWRYANARAEASSQALERETRTKVNSLRAKMSEMYDSVVKKRLELGILQRTQALSAILEAQTPYLDQWSDIEEDYSVSLAESIQALVNASIQLPLGGNIRVDVKEVHESLSSAVKVMDSIASHVQPLFSKAGETEILMSELAKIVGGEKSLVEECGGLLSKTHRLQVDECSLRAQIIQLHA